VFHTHGVSIPALSAEAARDERQPCWLDAVHRSALRQRDMSGAPQDRGGTFGAAVFLGYFNGLKDASQPGKPVYPLDEVALLSRRSSGQSSAVIRPSRMVGTE
jgi:hypothetical protein